jgi:hypothetical protein
VQHSAPRDIRLHAIELMLKQFPIIYVRFTQRCQTLKIIIDRFVVNSVLFHILESLEILFYSLV